MDERLAEALAARAEAEAAAQAKATQAEAARDAAKGKQPWWAPLAAARRAEVARDFAQTLAWIEEGRASREGALEAFIEIYNTDEKRAVSDGAQTRRLKLIEVDIAHALRLGDLKPPLLCAYGAWAAKAAGRGDKPVSAEAPGSALKRQIEMKQAARDALAATAQAQRETYEEANTLLEANALQKNTIINRLPWSQRVFAEKREDIIALNAERAELESVAEEAKRALDLAEGDLILVDEDLRGLRQLQGASQASARARLDRFFTPLALTPPPGHDLIDMVSVPAGRSWMGSADIGGRTPRDEIPLRRVEISRPYLISRYLVTQALYIAVMGENPSRYRAPLNPVERVSWFDAARFCNALSQLSGLRPAYVIGPGARPEVRLNPKADGYRLPTEAEWERAARADEGFEYAGADDLSRVGWFDKNCPPSPQAVGRKAPNGWGIYDLSGNLWEWCQDYYAADYYQRGVLVDPPGPEAGEARVLRGGSSVSPPERARVNARSKAKPHGVDVFIGFRVARAP
ncbi:formylglycine-generating enzyme family protein [Myxococcota bacterium]|nr:formylglycine-generating enzyme family protein [Myxococcota bacterium]MBU1428985.1 formylglycine-generating enzyme family protein [Myxococcota bacterium]MBU1897639.1 formylglycine-generating enzyme family protein [Myxococcota bacterium]